MSETSSLADLERCFGGAIPAVLATASADGVANVTYISRAHRVDADRVAFLARVEQRLAGV